MILKSPTLPRVIIHNAVSLDGRVDWLDADAGLFYELAGHWREDCTLAGSDTLLRAQADAPPQAGPAARPEPPPSPDPRALLAVVDSRGRLRSWDYWRSRPDWRDAVALVTPGTPPAYLEALRQNRVESIVTGGYHVDLRAALLELNARYGVRVARVESGGALNGALLRAGLVDEVSLLVHPALVGGTSPRSFFRAEDLNSSEGVIRLEAAHVEPMRGGVVWLRYTVVR